jgi:Fur family peroxide stress response transcriptional regulator
LGKNRSERLEKLVASSREKGLKLTPQRMIIFRILSESDAHMTSDEVYQKARKEYPMISAATVYRNMERMVKAGLLSHMGRSGSAVKYDTNLEEHHHFVCNRCGKVRDIYLEKIKYEVDEKRSGLLNAKIESPELYLRGICEDCLKGSR